MHRLKIAIVVHGRFHAFDLARALLGRGHNVTVFTNYPTRVAGRFGLPPANVRGFVTEGVLSRVLARCLTLTPSLYPDGFVHTLFGKWAARQVAKEHWDLIHCFTGVAEECLREAKSRGIPHQLVRGSAHILVQDRLLAEEQARVGGTSERASRWMIERELREYELAERIIVLSKFARDSFLEQGLPPDKVRIVALGVETGRFKARPDVVEARKRRILAGERLRVLCTGTASYQKGFYDFAEMVRALKGRMQFRFVGKVVRETAKMVRELSAWVEFTGRRPHFELANWYAEADLFVYPTIQDGFAAVITQAMAGALPVLCTTNCSGPDLIRDGENGWVLPIRNASAFIERLEWCDAHREELVNVIDRAAAGNYESDWSHVALEFERQSKSALPPANGA